VKPEEKKEERRKKAGGRRKRSEAGVCRLFLCRILHSELKRFYSGFE